MDFAPSQEARDADDRRWRKCAGAAVFNSRGQLLVGERIKIRGAWNCPQGGMDAASAEHGGAETVLEAATREAFEECGLRLGEHIVQLGVIQDDSEAVRYEAGGWLKAAGFAGQQLHWAIYGCCDPMGDVEPSLMVDLGGLGGEPAEFSAVRWQPLDAVIDGVWPAKRKLYEVLRAFAAPILEAHAAAAAAIDLSGTWSRNAAASSGLTQALLARGHTEEGAATELAKGYVQAWARAEGGAWRVTTFGDDGVTPRRTLMYPLGEWEEGYEGSSTIFGAAAGGGTLRRRTAWMPMPDADAAGASVAAGLLGPCRAAHTTWTARQDGGVEVSARFLRRGDMVLRRTFVQKGKPNIVSEEVFRREGKKG